MSQFTQNDAPYKARTRPQVSLETTVWGLGFCLFVFTPYCLSWVLSTNLRTQGAYNPKTYSKHYISCLVTDVTNLVSKEN